MKKFLSFIIVLIALVGIFSPVFKVNAGAVTPPSDPTGTCTSYDNNGNITSTTPNSTQSACTSPSTFVADPLGNCIFSTDGTSTGNTETDPNYTKTACTAKGAYATWVGYYNLLQPLPGVGSQFNPSSATGQPSSSLSSYLNPMITVFIGICAVLAVVMILFGGIEYMTSELISSKEAGKERIRNALLGLVLALGAWTILYTINPNLLNSDINIPDVIVNANLSSPILTSIYTVPATAANIARCTPPSSGPCTVSNLTSTFGSKATGMSDICNVESGGITTAASGTDKGTDGTVFSFGLFQVNLLANGSVIKGSNGESCANLFELSNGSPIVNGNYIQKNSSGQTYYNAILKPGMQQTYNDCKATLLDPVQNTKIAGILFNQGSSAFNNSMFAWSGDKSVCPSAFN